MNPINFLPKDGEAYLFPDVFSVNESNEYLHCLVNQIEWKHEPIIIFGKSIMQPRLTAWYGDKEKSYRYSGITMNPLEWTEALLNIKLKVEERSLTLLICCLINPLSTQVVSSLLLISD